MKTDVERLKSWTFMGDFGEIDENAWNMSDFTKNHWWIFVKMRFHLWKQHFIVNNAWFLMKLGFLDTTGYATEVYTNWCSLHATRSVRCRTTYSYRYRYRHRQLLISLDHAGTTSICFATGFERLRLKHNMSNDTPDKLIALVQRRAAIEQVRFSSCSRKHLPFSSIPRSWQNHLVVLIWRRSFKKHWQEWRHWVFSRE